MGDPKGGTLQHRHNALCSPTQCMLTFEEMRERVQRIIQVREFNFPDSRKSATKSNRRPRRLTH
jgi:hypothetical protein